VSIVTGFAEVFALVTEHQHALHEMGSDKLGSQVLRSEIAATQTKLRTIQSVLSEWQHVQTQWLRLCEVFLVEGAPEASQSSSVAQLMARRSRAQSRIGPKASTFMVQEARSPGSSTNPIELDLPKESQLLYKVGSSSSLPTPRSSR
jgi:hypothetical protein